MKNLKISAELLLPHIFILALLVLGIIFSIMNLTDIRKQTEELYRGSIEMIRAAGTVSETVEAMQTAAFRAISDVVRGNADDTLTEAKDLGESLREQTARLKRCTFGDRGALVRLEASLAEFLQMHEHVLALTAQNKSSEAAEYMESRSVPAGGELQTELAQLVQSAEDKEQEFAASLRQSQQNAVIFLSILGAVGVLFAFRDGTYLWRLYKVLRQSSVEYHPEQMK